MYPALRLRPTVAQAAGRGVHTGGLVGGAGSLVAMVAGWVVADGLGPLGWMAVLSPLLAGSTVGVALGLAYGRSEGADADHVGIRSVPGAWHGYARWRQIADLRTERHGGRVQVAVYLRDGRCMRLPAPYHGRLLAADPEFERKLVMLRHLWIAHRHARRDPGR
jgi:hypothetical protein